MHRFRFFLLKSEPSQFPRMAWLELTEIMLNIAHDMFALSKKWKRVSVLEWVGIRLLRLATKALGHAPAEQYVEFRADLPVQI